MQQPVQRDLLKFLLQVFFYRLIVIGKAKEANEPMACDIEELLAIRANKWAIKKDFDKRNVTLECCCLIIFTGAEARSVQSQNIANSSYVTFH